MIKIRRDSLAFRIYRSLHVEEAFGCNYELNPIYRKTLEDTGLKVTGVSEDGGARIVEQADHCFFLGTGFLPQLTSEAARPHPLIVAFLETARQDRNGAVSK